MYLYSTIALACLSLVLAVALWFASARNESLSVEPRLIGTWISDADKTAAMFHASTDKDSEAFRQTSRLLGKMKITFSATEMSVEIDGEIIRTTYRVLAADEYSCVIEQVANESRVDKETLDILKPSRFSIIHFDDSDSYWVHSQLGGFTEYFRRIAP